jgi:N-methylhydantoinase A/oxoprolinase/acetone carboxylase beta subunit
VDTIATAMGVDTKRAAAGIIDIVNENMFGALRLVSIQQGYDPRDFALVAFGGAGPLHANALGRLMGSWPVIIPPSPGVLCAYGDATTRVRNDSARTFIRRFSETSDGEVAATLRELAAEAAHALAGETRRSGIRSTFGTTGRASRYPSRSMSITSPSTGWGESSTRSTSRCSRSRWTPSTSW